MRRWLPLVVLVPACVLGVWSFPKEAPRVEAASLLGEVLWESFDPRLVTSGASWQGERIVVVVHQAQGYAGDDWSEVEAEALVFSVDPDSLQSEEIPVPEGLAAHPELHFGYGLDPGSVVMTMGDDAFASVMRVFDGAGWVELPLDIAYNAMDQALYHDGRVVLTEFDRIRVGADAMSLREIGPEVADEAFVVAWEGDDVQVVWRDEADLCTATWSASTGSGGPETCTGILVDYATRLIPALSGTPDGFQVAVPTESYRAVMHAFVDGTWTEGAQLPITHLLDHPGSSLGFAVASDLDAFFGTLDYVVPTHPSLYHVEDGLFVDKALDDFHVDVPCDCTRGPDSDCTCLAHAVTVSMLLAAPDASALGLFTADGIDATVRTQLRVLAPADFDPLHGHLDCDLECDFGRCDLDVDGAPFCEKYDHELDPTR